MTENNNKIKNSNGIKFIGGVTVLIALIGGMAAIIRPMQQQIDAVTILIDKSELRTKEDLKKTDDKIQGEIEYWRGLLTEQLKKLDEKLQLELEGKDDLQTLSKEFLDQRLKLIEERFKEDDLREVSDAKVIAILQEKIKKLEECEK